VSQIPKIKSKKGTGTWNPNRITTFQGQSAKRHSNKKNVEKKVFLEGILNNPPQKNGTDIK